MSMNPHTCGGPGPTLARDLLLVPKTRCILFCTRGATGPRKAETGMFERFTGQARRVAGDFGISPVSIAEIPHLVERSASRLC